MSREGTGRYQNINELHSCIATEKGLLEREDFEHIQKIIEVYSKCLLCETRVKHINERLVPFQNQDWKTYTKCVFKQQQKEVKLFNAATLEILSVAGIKTPVFNQSIELMMVTSQDSLV